MSEPQRGMPTQQSRRGMPTQQSQRGMPTQQSQREPTQQSQREPTSPTQSSEPTQPSLRRLRQFGIRPDRELGQNFLVDSNILGVIAREAELDGEDVVLEIGGGVGVLSEYLAERARHVHVVEIDRRLEEALMDAVGRFDNVTVHWTDAVKLDLAELSPPPSKVVANLPYGVAATALLRTIELEWVGLWVAMVQREVGERLAAAPGGSEYGVSSVIAQLSCEVKVARTVSRTVFHPVPNVDSVLVRMVRTAPAASPRLRALVRAAFAHRRKALAGSLALAAAADAESGGRAFRGEAEESGGDGARVSGSQLRGKARDAVQTLGHPADVRAERLSPEEFRSLGEMLL